MLSTYKFKSKVWLYTGDGAWHFVSVPKEESKEIKSMTIGLTNGFGSIPVEVKIGKTTWSTSIFPDSKTGTYLLPLKKAVRVSEKISVGDEICIAMDIKIDY
jgi:hypothetical protein